MLFDYLLIFLLATALAIPTGIALYNNGLDVSFVVVAGVPFVLFFLVAALCDVIAEVLEWLSQ